MVNFRKHGAGAFEIYLQSAFWLILLGIIFYITSYLFKGQHAIHRILLVLFCHIVNFYLCYAILVPKIYEKGRYKEAFMILALWLTAISYIRFEAEDYIIRHADNLVIQLLYGGKKYAFIMVTNFIVSVIASLMRLAVSNHRNMIRMEEIKRLQIETELRFLKAQINPHFLFNTINNIYSLVLLKSGEAPGALLKLSALLRYMLYECNQKVPVYKELDALQTYISLFRLKFEDALNISIDLKVQNQHAAIEPLLLIPLAENALKHSGIGINAASCINISVIEDKNIFNLSISNSKLRMNLKSDTGGIGLVNIQKRLEVVYPDLHELKIEETETSFKVTLILYHP